MEPAGRDTFQAKTIRNREAVPPGAPNLPGNGTVKKKRRVLHSVIDKVFNWNNLKSASRKVVRNKGSAGVYGLNAGDSYRTRTAANRYCGVTYPSRGAQSSVRSAYPR